MSQKGVLHRSDVVKYSPIPKCATWKSSYALVPSSLRTSEQKVVAYSDESHAKLVEEDLTCLHIA